VSERVIHLAAVWALVPVLERPVLVAVDGPDAAGKTTLADALADSAAGRTVVRASLDDFHHPRAHRYAEGRTGQTVWHRSVDLVAVRRELLDPWRHGAGTPYRRRWHDLAGDVPLDEAVAVVPEQGVLVVDGVFAQRPELDDAWDLVVYVDAPDDVRIVRMAERDGVSPDADHPDQRRYLDAQRIYLTRCRPRERADMVIDNRDPTAARITRISPWRPPVPQNGAP
jgi:uridine kinase